VIVTLELQVSARCHACSVLTPMVGIRNRLSCRGCAAAIDFEAKVKDSRDGGVTYPFGGYYDVLAEASTVLADGEKCQDASDSSGSPTALKRVGGPACPTCSAGVDVPVRGAESLSCRGCGDVVGVRWPDDETRTWDPRIYCIVGDGLAPKQAAREARTQGTLISCGQCGAPLTGDQTDRRRARTCAHCSAVNYLGDAAILALFPQPEWHRSYLVYDVDDKLHLALCQRMLREEENHYFLEDDQVAAVQRTRAKLLSTIIGDPASLSEAAAKQYDDELDDTGRDLLLDKAGASLVKRWARSKSDTLRKQVARHQACPADALVGLAADPNSEIRAIAAARPELPPEVIAKLRKDSDEDVAKAAKSNLSYKPGFFEKLFG
jgi:hypothetical protein